MNQVVIVPGRLNSEFDEPEGTEETERGVHAASPYELNGAAELIRCLAAQSKLKRAEASAPTARQP